MNLVDIVIVLVVIGGAFWGSQKRLVAQVSILLGVVVGLFGASVVYDRLAFLGQNSASRGIVLGLLTLAIGFLCCDIILSVGRRLQQRFGWRSEELGKKERIASGGVAALSALFVIWLVFGIFANALPTDVQKQIKAAEIYKSLQGSLPIPEVMRRAATILDPFGSPEVFVGDEPSFDTSVAVSATFENLDSAVAAAAPAVFKVNAWGCGSASAGSGFLTGSKRTIITNAHVVAGADRISVQDTKGSYTAQPIWFDPELDIAVLAVAANVAADPLGLETSAVPNGTVLSILGYPAGGDFIADDVIIVETLNAEGYDIYTSGKVLRNIYALRATVVPGNSGGPVITAAGKVAGVVIGHSTIQNRTGYAITANQIEGSVSAALSRNQVVSTGSCTTS